MKVEIPIQRNPKKSLIESLRAETNKVVSRSDDRSPTGSLNSPTFSPREYQSFDSAFSKHGAPQNYNARLSYLENHNPSQISTFLENERIVE